MQILFAVDDEHWFNVIIKRIINLNYTQYNSDWNIEQLANPIISAAFYVQITFNVISLPPNTLP